MDVLWNSSKYNDSSRTDCIDSFIIRYIDKKVYYSKMHLDNERINWLLYFKLKK